MRHDATCGTSVQERYPYDRSCSMLFHLFYFLCSCSRIACVWAFVISAVPLSNEQGFDRSHKGCVFTRSIAAHTYCSPQQSYRITIRNAVQPSGKANRKANGGYETRSTAMVLGLKINERTRIRHVCHYIFSTGTSFAYDKALDLLQQGRHSDRALH